MTGAQMRKAADEQADVMVLGHKHLNKAFKNASQEMIEYLESKPSKEEKIQATSELAFEMGMAEALLETAIPVISGMQEQIKDLDIAKGEEKVMMWMFVARALRNLKK